MMEGWIEQRVTALEDDIRNLRALLANLDLALFRDRRNYQSGLEALSRSVDELIERLDKLAPVAVGSATIPEPVVSGSGFIPEPVIGKATIPDSDLDDA